jgi:hypothetical protein
MCRNCGLLSNCRIEKQYTQEDDPSTLSFGGQAQQQLNSSTCPLL